MIKVIFGAVESNLLLGLNYVFCECIYLFILSCGFFFTTEGALCEQKIFNILYIIYWKHSNIEHEGEAAQADRIIVIVDLCDSWPQI